MAQKSSWIFFVRNIYIYIIYNIYIYIYMIIYIYICQYIYLYMIYNIYIPDSETQENVGYVDQLGCEVYSKKTLESVDFIQTLPV